MTDDRHAAVCAVVVTHYPDSTVLQGLLASVSAQVGCVVVVDNSAEDMELPPGHADVTLIRQGRNGGLAQAQNVGLDWARQHAFDYVLLLDQDSTPDDGMVCALLDALRRLGDSARVAAVGPRFHDVLEARDAPFVKVGFPLNHKRWCDHPGQLLECDFLISSGALIPLTVIDDIGSMDESLFIDNVDLEWSFRARARGYKLYGVCAAAMQHQLGDSRRQLPFGLGQVIVHGPVRLYYIMRNRFRLYRLPHTPWIWVAQDMPRLAVKLFLFAAMIGPRARNIRFMLRGLWDGFRSKSGPCPLA
ncbi:glycosyltransferase family 2 protein [Dyella ginsengisoli]|uniref:Glycosyltransferase family 2 protein n=1 Tax=Dyella ginsengisoli TaxID=363848 RepID=A0ABW8JSL5_9GAMM